MTKTTRRLHPDEKALLLEMSSQGIVTIRPGSVNPRERRRAAAAARLCKDRLAHMETETTVQISRQGQFLLWKEEEDNPDPQA